MTSESESCYDCIDTARIVKTYQVDGIFWFYGPVRNVTGRVRAYMTSPPFPLVNGQQLRKAKWIQRFRKNMHVSLPNVCGECPECRLPCQVSGRFSGRFAELQFRDSCADEFEVRVTWSGRDGERHGRTCGCKGDDQSLVPRTTSSSYGSVEFGLIEIVGSLFKRKYRGTANHLESTHVLITGADRTCFLSKTVAQMKECVGPHVARGRRSNASR